MKDMLQLCVEVDSRAAEAYEMMAAATDDERLREVFEKMARDEREHLDWWRELEAAWEKGLLPDIFNDTEDIEERMRELETEVRSLVPASIDGMSRQEMLTLAARMEYFMLNPVFGELLDLVEPDTAHERQLAYRRHVERLVRAIEEHSEDRSLAAFLARVLRMSWETNRALAKWAMRDSLTGLFNRRALDAYLRQWLAWAARYGRPLAVLMIDTDDLKRINDRHGHAVGDQVLCAIAMGLRRSVRASDTLARWGGDEFVVLAPETGAEALEQLAERILAETRAGIVESADGERVAVTVSIGSTVMHERPDSVVRRPDDLIAAADRSLYEAKAAGRDRYAEPVALAEA